jgi:hypothetical protein
LSYGPLSNDFLLMDYGFVIPDNPHDRVALRFEMDLVNVSGSAIGSACTGVEPLIMACMACISYTSACTLLSRSWHARHASVLVRQGRKQGNV